MIGAHEQNAGQPRLAQRTVTKSIDPLYHKTVSKALEFHANLGQPHLETCAPPERRTVHEDRRFAPQGLVLRTISRTRHHELVKCGRPSNLVEPEFGSLLGQMLRQFESKEASLVRLALDPNPPPMRLRDALDDRQAEPAALWSGTRGAIDGIE